MATRAYDAQINGIYYNLNNSSRTATVTGLTGGPSGNSSAYSGEVEIPESVTYGSTTYNVTAIGDYAFKDCTALTGVVIPSTVANFGEDTFFGCTGLEYVIALIETPFEIPQYTFYYNSKSEGIKPLSYLLFVLGDTWSWKWNNWGSNPKSDGNTFSADVDGIETKFDVISVKDRTCKLYDGFGAIPKTVADVYTIPERTFGLTVTGIGYGAFMDCAQLTGIIIPNTVTDIDFVPFYNCTSLISITIPSSVKSIKGATFKLTNITEVKVDEANGVYDSRDNCNAIIETSTNTLMAGCKASTIPNTVTAIADMAFEGTGIAAIDIPEQVTSIGASAFRYCDKLASVTVEMREPVVITEDVFTNRANATLHVPYGCKAAYEAADYWKEFKEIVEMDFVSTAITFTDANVKALCVANWDKDGDGELSEAEAAAVTSLGSVFTENKNIHFFEDLQFFTGLTEISTHAFYNCNSLSKVTIPENVTIIGDGAFYQCLGLKFMNIPDNVTKIDNSAFSGCTWLESINIGNNVEEIGEGAFWQCVSLTNLIIPDNVVSIGTMAFYKTYLKSLTIGSKLTAIGSSAFYGANDGQLASIVVKANNSKYDSRNNCNAIIETESNTLVLGCKNTIIPNSVKTIGFRAFDNAFNDSDNPPVSLDIPTGVETISGYAFSSCQRLGSVFIPSTVETIGDYAFDGCHKLVSVSIDKSIPVNINSHTFSNSKNATLYVPYGCKEVYAAADYWKNFKEIVEMEPEIVEKCAAPTIAYDRGELVVKSETEGAECHVAISTADAGEQKGGRISLTPTYTITAWATAEGYAESDRVMAALTWRDSGLQAEGMTIVATKDEAADVNGDGVIDVSDYIGVANIILTGNIHGE